MRKHQRGQSAPVTPDIGAAAARVCSPEDSALLALLHDAGLHVSEAAALSWSDVEIESDGSAGIASVRDGKAGGGGVAMGPCAVRALAAIRPGGGRGDAPAFRVERRQGRRPGVQGRAAAARAAAEGVTSHGGRVGLARTVAGRGACAPVIMRQGGWKSLAMIVRYIRGLSAKEAVRFL